MSIREQDRTDVVVLKNGKPLEADMVANHLDKEEIPFYRRHETSAGIELAMPFQPVQGAGDFWTIRVFPEKAGAAREIIDRLPVDATVNPGVWHYGPTDRVKRFIKFCAWATLVLSLLFLVAWIIQNVGEL